MDLQALGAKALFVPTPGQTEQEYLAAFFMNEGIALSRTQDKLNLANDLDEAFKFTGFEKRTISEKYKTVLDALLKK
jgi:UDP-N-acetylglucosamine:LPS N-acetylglucosamine transferase